MSTKPESMDAAFLVGADGTIASWNAACERLLGYAPREVLSRPLANLLTIEGRQQLNKRLAAARLAAQEVELDIVCASGNLARGLRMVPQCSAQQQCLGFRVLLGASDAKVVREREEEIIGRTALRDMVDFIAGTFYVINQDGYLVMWNKRVEQATRLTHDEIAATHALEMFRADERPQVGAKIREVFEHDGEVQVEAHLLSKHGAETPYLFTGARFIAENKPYLCGMGLDLSERRKHEEQLRLRERALHASSNAIIIIRCDHDSHLVEYVNPAFERITGYSASEIVGSDSRYMVGFMTTSGLDDIEQAELRLAIDERRELSVTFRTTRKNGEVFWNELTVAPVRNDKGVATHFIGVFNDVTETKRRTSFLEHEVNHDPLTGLANRNLLWDRLEQALHLSQRNKTLVAIILVDLDNFKTINDSMGHDAGDEVLRAVARRLQASVRDSDTVARLGGDEFVLVLTNQPNLRYTLRMIDRLRRDMAKEVSINGKQISVESSMGVAVFPNDGATSMELIQAADVAMYHAKAAGRNDVHFFSEEMKTSTEAKRKLEANMREAVEREEMFLVLQPRLSLTTGKIVGAEALLRWRHPEQGVLLPGAFLAEAEENGLIVPLGDWVFKTVCGMLKRLKELGFDDLPMSMNVSYREFSQRNYVALLSERLRKWDLAPASFELEIKEANLLRNPQLSRDIFAAVSELGIKLTIDDFGAGVSSLSNLQQLPINHIKIYKPFIDDINPERVDGVLAKTTIAIGRNMNIVVVGEGVETRQQLNFLKVNGCDQMQGNFFCAPIALPAFERLLRDVNSKPAPL